MTVTINRKISLALLFLLIHLLWVGDLLTNFSQRSAARILRYTLVVCLLIFCAKSASSYKYTSDIFLGAYYRLNGYAFLNMPEVRLKPIEYPVPVSNVRVPYISARSVFVMDNSTDKILFQINSELQLAPASTTKLMTALVGLEKYSPDEELMITSVCANVDSTKAYLAQGARYKVRDLIYAMLVSSAGDAACAVASGKISLEEFVTLMNDKAKQLGMVNTHFSNPIGLDGNGNNKSTARDLYILSSAAMEYPLIRDAVDQKTYEIKSTDSAYAENMQNTNRLLWEVAGTLGIKTGTTAEAGEVLIYENADTKKDLVIIVMSSRDRFGDTTKLLDWVNAKYRW